MSDPNDFVSLTDADGVSYCFAVDSLWFFEPGITYEEYLEAKRIKFNDPEPDPASEDQPDP